MDQHIEKQIVHFLPSGLINRSMKFTIALIGCGGTGSAVLQALGRINAGFIMEDLPGLHVTVYDPQDVESHNVGRQMFSYADVGENKAVTYTDRINRYYGLDWDAIPEKYENNQIDVNMYITCVDTARDRVRLHRLFGLKKKLSGHVPEIPFYWVDLGNGKRFGQMIMGTINPVDQPDSKAYNTKSSLMNVFELHPGLMVDDPDDKDLSCSAHHTLAEQDLFINSTLGNLFGDFLWKFLSDFCTDTHGFYFNFDESNYSQLKITE